MVAHVHECGGLGTIVERDDAEPLAGERYYYVHVVQADGQQAWSSPIWIRHGG